MDTLNRPVSRWTIAIGYSLVVIAYLLQQPGTPAVEVVAPVAAPDWQREVVFTIGHVVGFGVLFALWWWALAERGRAAFYAALVTLGIGLLAEILQSQLPQRSASAYDMLMNSIGITLAYIVITRQRRSLGK